jgi:polyether ionophore transport system permease protein
MLATGPAMASVPATAALTPARWTRYRLPQFTAARFIGRHSAPVGAIWGLVFGLYVYDNAFAFDTIARTAALRTQLLTSMGRNAGLKALLGDTQQITTRGGFTDWRAIGVITLVASIWGLLAATKTFRGEETAGRWEMFLAGQTTHRRAAANALAGLGAGVLAMYLLTALLTALVGARPGVGISPGRSLFFALAVVAGAAMFAGVGAVTSQLMATRARAAGTAAAVLGVAFMLRAMGDTTSSGHWLVYLSPLGWVEQLHPLTGPQPVWLLPIAGLVVLCVGLTVLLSGRDLGTSLLADKDTATARTGMLGSPVLFALRLSWASIAGWLAAAVVGGALYGSLAKSTGEAFASSGMLRKFTGNLTHTAVRELQLTGARVYAGVIFLILMTLIMAYVAAAMGRVREDEAEGYLDNLVVRRVSRPRWLAGRAGLILAVLVLAGLLGGIAFWAAAASGHAGLGLHELLLAGINAAAPAALLLGAGLLTLGFVPRLTAVVCWGLLAWAFLLDMLGSAVRINHWLMDTSLLYHPALAPAVSPDWRITGTYLAAGAVAALIGGWRFTRRDLQSS